ncbi:MAG: hypothetical protein PHW00_03460 [Clostridia bacterium]|nr:hypothetical protein [Clostridia bacterium]
MNYCQLCSTLDATVRSLALTLTQLPTRHSVGLMLLECYGSTALSAVKDR